MSWGEDEYIRVGGLRLRVVRAGSGPPLLLINGIGAPIELWRPLAARLGGRELVMFDLPGSGDSSDPIWPSRIRDLAATVVRLLDELGLGRLDVLGYSFGGVVAQELALRAPGRVRRLVLCATGPGLPSLAPNPLALLLMLTPARHYTRWLGELIVPLIGGGRTARDRAALEADLRLREANPPSPLGYAQQLLAVAGWTSRPWLRRLAQETLVLHGDEDPLLPLGDARSMASAIPNARLSVVEGAGHLFLIDAPERAVDAIEAFLDDG